jgi:hypothetical protein
MSARQQLLLLLYHHCKSFAATATINMINGSIRRLRCFNSTIIIAASPSYGTATTFDFQHVVLPSDADNVTLFHHH